MSDIDESHVAMARITDALFCSELETGDAPSRRQLATAIRRALRTHRNWNGCTRAVASSFAKSPTEAARREAWCHELAENAMGSVDIRLEFDDLE